MTSAAIRLPATRVESQPGWLMGASWAALGAWGAAALIVAAAPASSAAAIAAPVQGLALLGFAFTFAATALGWRGAMMFAGAAFAIALAIENLSVATGVPFGFFSHSDEFGAKIGAVPVVVALGYFLYGFPAFMLARLVVGAIARGWMTPVIAAFIVTGFELTHDPVGASLEGFWQFNSPSGLNGVPLSNFVGWLITAGAIFAVWQPICTRFDRSPDFFHARFWAAPIAFWLVSALQYPLMLANAPAGSVSVGDAVLPRADILETATINALLVMGFTVLLGIVRLAQSRPARTI